MSWAQLSIQLDLAHDVDFQIHASEDYPMYADEIDPLFTVEVIEKP